jgi:asparagine synthase (glutamine-hydrolysing)
MKHRGPNDEGLFVEHNIGLGFVRLSILDLSPLGHQPMFSNIQLPTTNSQLPTSHIQQPNRYVILHNGEVYNYIEMRNELISKGYSFKSNTDTEVVLNSFIEWGDDCLHRFNGMWSFVIYDRQTKEFFGSRDRFGVKPFYYYEDENEFIFSSEIPPILDVIQNKPSINKQSLFDYMVFNRTDQTEQTFFNNIKKLQHGHQLIIHKSKIKIQKWYDLRARVKKTQGFTEASEYRELFSNACGLRLRSDVPVGVCLSGGLDSSSIVSILLKDYNLYALNTFSAIYEKGQTGDESDYIKSFTDSLKKMKFTTPTAQTLHNDLNDFITAHAEPIPSTSPYAQFKVMELAKSNVVVTLDGQGADEELAGYHYFFGFYFKELLKNLKLRKLLKESSLYLLNHNSIFGLKSFLYFLLPTRSRTSLRMNEKGYLLQEFLSYNSHSVIGDELYSSSSLPESLLNHFEFKLEHLLKWEDRNSMWFSLEARVPFLDFRLAEKTLATNSDLIIKNGMTKHLLREAMQGVLPEKIRLRKDKVGFETPQDEWFRSDLFRNFIIDLISSASFKERNIFNVKKVKELYEAHLSRKKSIGKEIWKWINLELWFRKFFD